MSTPGLGDGCPARHRDGREVFTCQEYCMDKSILFRTDESVVMGPRSILTDTVAD